MSVCLRVSAGAVSVLLRPVTGVHRVILNKERAGGRGGEHLFTLILRLACSQLPSVLSVLLHPFCVPTDGLSGSLYSAVYSPNKGDGSDFYQSELLG